jgi:diaminopimelate decarboxylase
MHVPRARRSQVVEQAEALLRRFGSPLYVYDLDEIERRYLRFVQAFPYRPLQCHYALVCNKNPLIVRRLHELGAGVHANTPGDAFAALAAGVPAGDVVYSGTNLSCTDLDYLLARHVALNVDSLDQLRDLVRHGGCRSVGLRLLIDDPAKRNRIGVSPRELREALRIAEIEGIRVSGLHMYAGTNNRRLSRFLGCVDRLLAAAETLPDLEYVNLGGGYGIGYREGEPDLDVDLIGQEVARRLQSLSRRRGQTVRLIVEPGRVLVASAGSLLMRVVSVKHRGGRRYIGVDTTVGNIVAPSVYHGYHRLEALSPRGAALELTTDVCGNTTHSGDFIARDVRLPPVEAGDVLALRDVGAYAYAMSSHFLNRPRPAEVVLDGGEAILTTRRERFEDLVALYEPGVLAGPGSLASGVPA